MRSNSFANDVVAGQFSPTPTSVAAAGYACACPACAAGPAAASPGPQENGVGADAQNVGRSGDQRIDGLLGGVRWATAAVSYSDPDRPTDYEATHPEDRANLEPLSAAQLRTAQAALDTAPLGQPAAHRGFSVEGFTGLGVAYAGPGSGAATIRLANTSDPKTAYAYLPDAGVEGGDAFFGGSGRAPVVGNYDHHTIIHEIGHTLGLKHGHDADVYGALPVQSNSMEFSVMTYRSFVGATEARYTNEASGFAQTWMMLDIAALQRMYGADFGVNAGDTVYSWSRTSGATSVDGEVALTPGANRIFMTVWDGGGEDTYDLSGYVTPLAIDLAPGGHSTLKAGQRADLGGGPNGGEARGNVFNALEYRGDPRSLIENAVGGSADDGIRGNDAANRLDGRGGDDDLRGLDGRDVLRGGSGADRLTGGGGADVPVGGTGPDVFRFLTVADSRPGARDRLWPGDGGAAFDRPGAAFGDRIELSGIDANAAAGGDQAFLFGAARGIGRLWLAEAEGETLVRGNVDDSAPWEFELAIADGSVRAAAYSAADFIL